MNWGLFGIATVTDLGVFFLGYYLGWRKGRKQ